MNNTRKRRNNGYARSQSTMPTVSVTTTWLRSTRVARQACHGGPQGCPETVHEILHRLPHGVITVGVLRDEMKERVVELVNTLGLGGAQLHGREPLSDVRWIRKRVPFVIQGFAAGDPALAAVGNGP